MSVQAFALEGVEDYPENEVYVADLELLLQDLIEANEGRFSIARFRIVTDAIAAYYRERGFFLARAFIPEQKIKDGTVKIVVLEGRLSAIEVENNYLYEQEVVQEPLDELLDKPLRYDETESALLYLRDYPGLKYKAVFRPGKEPGTAATVVHVEEEDAFEGAVWFDNYGSEYTGEYRLRFDGRINNIGGAADFLIFNIYKSMPNTSGVFGSILYDRPILNYKTRLGIGYSSNRFHVGKELSKLEIRGESTAINLYLKNQWLRSRSRNAYILGDLSKKSTRVKVLDKAPGVDQLTVLSLLAGGDFQGLWSAANVYSVKYSKGLPDTLGAMPAKGSSDPTRQGESGKVAGGDFSKWNLQYQWTKYLSRDQAINLRLNSQFSKDLLTSMEQMPLGGPYSVRGYSVSEALMDEALFASLEWLTFSTDMLEGGLFSNTQFSIYLDYAEGRLNDPRANDVGSIYLSGLGAGVQLEPKDSLFARLDLALPIGEPEPDNKRSIQYYFLFGYRF